MALLSGAAQAQVTTTETLNFDNNLMPVGWNFSYVGSPGLNLQITNQRFEIGQYDTYGGLTKPIDTNGVTQIRIEFDSNIAPVYGGQGSAAILASNPVDWLHDGAVVLFSLNHATYGPLTFESQFRPTTGSSSNLLYRNQTPIAYGNYHMDVLFEDGQVSQTVTNLATGTSFSSGLVAAPGLLLANMRGMLLNGYTTTGTSTWIDNASISITTAVPEPESYALLLAGLGVLGAVRRRRRQATPTQPCQN